MVTRCAPGCEGVSFRNVRRVILGDLSPGNTTPSWSLVVPALGRPARCGP